MSVHWSPPPAFLSKEAWPPNYTAIFGWRIQQLQVLLNDEPLQIGAKAYYADHPAEFISHWMNTFDPRNAMDDLPSNLPFQMFQRQDDMVEFLLSCLTDQENGLIDKSRDMGATWVACAFSVWLWLFKPGASIGWGSRKQDLVDKLGDPDSIFQKMRMLILDLPRFFWPVGFSPEKHMTFQKIINPENGSTITGEAGDSIGRGGRKSIYFKDESAHYEHPESIEAALGDNTRCQIDMSTHNGIGTIFDRRRNSGMEWYPDRKFEKGATRVFVLDWRDHPAKTEEWYKTREKKAKDDGLIHIFRQEVDRDPAASLQGIIIPPEWVRAAIDAHLKIKGFELGGGWGGSLDPADEGGDLHALTLRKGVILRYADDWGEGDTGEATRTTILEIGQRRPIAVQYDCIGVGAGCKAEYNRLKKDGKLPLGITFVPWNAGVAVINPTERVIPGDKNTPLNEDFYSNLKAQGWWSLRRRFEKTFRSITEGIVFPTSELISLDSRIPKIRQLERELSQPVRDKDGSLRLKIEKKPEGARSPNMGDSVMMNYFPLKSVMVISDAALQRSRQAA